MSDETLLNDGSQPPIPDANIEQDAEQEEWQGIDKIFGDQGDAQPERKMVTMPEEDMKKILERLNNLEMDQGKMRVIDPANQAKRKKLIRVGFFTDEAGEVYLVTDLGKKVFPDGSVVTTWNQGTEPNSRGAMVPITVCRPIMYHITTKEKKEDIVRYDYFASVIRTVQMEVKSEKTVPVDITTIEETSDIVEYQELSNGRISPVPTGTKIRNTVMGVDIDMVVEYEGADYHIAQSVVNIK